VLVTGATGFLGAALVRRLLRDETASVRVLVRSQAKAKALADRGAEVIAGEISDEKTVRSALDGVSVVYHLAGRLFVPGIAESEYRRTHVEGANVLLGACEKAPGFARLVHCSTTGVLGTTGETAADEETPFRPTNVYESTKAEAELAVRARWRDRVPAVIARPGLVYGPGDLHLLSFFRSVLRHRFRPIGRKAVLLHPIYIDDLIEGLVRCGGRSEAMGECFHLAGKPSSLDEMATVIARIGGTRPPRGHIPVGAARTVAAFGDLAPARLRSAMPLTSSRLEFLTHSRVYDVSKAKRLLDFVAETDLATGMERTLAWYQEQGYLRIRAAA